MKSVKDIDYLFISTRIRALEASLLSRERMQRMLDAPSAEDAAKVLGECGYPDMVPLSLQSMGEAIAQKQQEALHDMASFVPNKPLLDAFRVKYDYHNAKTLLKAEAKAVPAERLLIDLGRVPVRELTEKLNAGDLRGLPSILQGGITRARETLGATRDPQLSDFALDHAYFEDMLAIAKEADSAFLLGYVRLLIDVANLRSSVRTVRLGKSGEFMGDILFDGGNMDAARVLAAASAGGSLGELFARSPLKEAAETGMVALSQGSLTSFEKLCDNAVTKYLGGAKYVSFGDAPVVAYLAAKEQEFTAVRILLTGRLAGLAPDIIDERLRDPYV